MMGFGKVAIILTAVSSALALLLEHDEQHPRPITVEDTANWGHPDTGAQAKLNNHDRRQLMPGDAEMEILKDGAKAGVWFAEHCAPEMVLARFQGRKPTYSEWKEKFMCPAIAKIFPHLLPFENPFDAPVVLMPGPVMANVPEPVGMAA